jgi:hypothetical protein
VLVAALAAMRRVLVALHALPLGGARAPIQYLAGAPPPALPTAAGDFKPGRENADRRSRRPVSRA